MAHGSSVCVDAAFLMRRLMSNNSAAFLSSLCAREKYFLLRDLAAVQVDFWSWHLPDRFATMPLKLPKVVPIQRENLLSSRLRTLYKTFWPCPRACGLLELLCSTGCCCCLIGWGLYRGGQG